MRETGVYRAQFSGGCHVALQKYQGIGTFLMNRSLLED